MNGYGKARGIFHSAKQPIWPWDKPFLFSVGAIGAFSRTCCVVHKCTRTTLS